MTLEDEVAGEEEAMIGAPPTRAAAVTLLARSMSILQWLVMSDDRVVLTDVAANASTSRISTRRVAPPLLRLPPLTSTAASVHSSPWRPRRPSACHPKALRAGHTASYRGRTQA